MGVSSKLVVPALAVLALAVVAGVSLTAGLQVSDLTRDAAAVAELHPLTGLLSNLGVLLWIIAGAVALFAASHVTDQRQAVNFLRFGAYLSIYLGLDDLFLLHETLIPQTTGIPEKAVYATLGVAMAYYLTRFAAQIRQSEWGWLAGAIFLLAASVLVDNEGLGKYMWRYLWRLDQWNYFIEDAFKWLGIVSWCTYQIKVAHDHIKHSRGPDSALPV